MMREIVTGQVEATGNDQEVELGFTPDYVRLINMNRVDSRISGPTYPGVFRGYGWLQHCPQED